VIYGLDFLFCPSIERVEFSGWSVTTYIVGSRPIPRRRWPVSAAQAAVGKHGPRARWPDFTQSLQPSRPAVACNIAPAGSLSHESGVNSSPPSAKLLSRTSNSIPLGIRTELLIPGAQRSSKQAPRRSRTALQSRHPGRRAPARKKGRRCRCVPASGRSGRIATV
jgi:hypothetical protein